MDFVLMSCPYCSRTVDSSDPDKYVCDNCGKFIYTDRSYVRGLIRSGELEDRFNATFDALESENERKALEIADDLVESTEGNDYDSLFLRGYVHCRIGEDGKALIDWRKGLELLSNSTNIDAYVCLISTGVAEMILFKEREFIEFSPLTYIDKLCDDIDSCTGLSCKAFVYYSIYRNCLRIEGVQAVDDEFDSIIPEIFKRIVAYHRNYRCLPRIIVEYLSHLGYVAETYEDDMNEVPHIYDLIAQTLVSRLVDVSKEEEIRIFDRWDDRSLKENLEPMLDSLLKQKGTVLGRLKTEDKGRPKEIEAYVDKCLLIERSVQELEASVEESQ